MESCLGEADLRLEVAERTAVTVQLLLGEDLLGRAGHWPAMRIDRDGRLVWRGPTMDVSPTKVARFLADLLTGPQDSLLARYSCLG